VPGLRVLRPPPPSPQRAARRVAPTSPSPARRTPARAPAASAIDLDTSPAVRRRSAGTRQGMGDRTGDMRVGLGGAGRRGRAVVDSSSSSSSSPSGSPAASPVGTDHEGAARPVRAAARPGSAHADAVHALARMLPHLPRAWLADAVHAHHGNVDAAAAALLDEIRPPAAPTTTAPAILSDGAVTSAPAAATDDAVRRVRLRGAPAHAAARSVDGDAAPPTRKRGRPGADPSSPSPPVPAAVADELDPTRTSTVCACACVRVCVYAFMLVRLGACVYAYVCLCVCLSLFLALSVCVCVCM
jgi:hypothetical protein